MPGRIPIAGPWITEKEISYVTDAVTNGWYSNAGIYNKRFEKAFAEYLGVGYAVSLPSCTSALHLSLLALGIGPGDEVIVPDITWIATSAPITYVGATPVFADVERDTWCLSATSFESCISSRTRAVIAVDLYGGMPDLDAIRSVAQRHGLSVIEDAAEAIGSRYKGRPAGTSGQTGAFSFHGSKTLTTGEGGMFVTQDPAVHDRVQILRDHGRRPGDTSFENQEVAFKYKMTAMQAALGLAQLERMEELVAKKRRIFSWYAERLSGFRRLALNAEPPQTVNSYWMVTVLDLDERCDKRSVIKELGERGIDSRPIFSPLSSLLAYNTMPQSAIARERNRNAYRIGKYGVNLPFRT